MSKSFIWQLTAASFIFANTLVANAADDDNGVENLVVTAARSPVSAASVGSSVSIIDRKFIEERQAVYVLDVLRDVPGVQVSRSGGQGKQTQIRIRGAEANQVLVMIDGIEVVDPAAADEFQWENLTTADIERIEVVRGPQSALWGSEALAGVINILTRGGEQGLVASGFAEGGSFDTYNAGARVAGGNETWSGGIGVSYLDTDGENVSRTGPEEDGYENTTVSLNGRWTPSEDFKLGLITRYTDAETYSDGTDFLVTGLPQDPVPISADKRREESDQLYMGLTGDLSTLEGRWTHNLRANLTSTDRDVYVDSGDKSAELNGDTYGLYYVSSIGLDGAVASDRPVLNLAADWKREEYEYRCFNADGVDCTAFGDPNQDEDRTNLGFVAELLSGEWNNFSATASIRYDDNDDFDNETTYRFTGAYGLDSGTRFRSAYGTGWKAPTFTELFGFFPDQFIGNPDLDPETSEGWEVGIDQPLLNGDINLSATYFNEKLEDEIASSFDPVTFLSTTVNLDGNSRRKGVELLADASVIQDLTLQLNYTYLDAKERNPAGGKNEELRRPRHSGAFNANYLFLQQKANVNLNVSYVGDRKDIFFPPFPADPAIVDLDEYWLVNLAAGYQLTDVVEIYGRIENLTNEDYEDVFGFNTQGAGGFAGVRVKFSR